LHRERRIPAIVAALAIYTKIFYIGVHFRGEIATMGRTNIEIDEALVEKARRLTGAKSKREAVDIALRRLVQKGTLYRALRRLRGKLAWKGDVDSWRSARTSRA
jgi:Arc/MetJ family transcription regulator